MERMPTDRTFRYRLLVVVGTWLSGVGAALSVGFGALRIIGGEVTDRASSPLSEGAVHTAAASLTDAADVLRPAGTPASERSTNPARSAGDRAPVPENGGRGRPTADAPSRPSSRGSPSRRPAGPPRRHVQVRVFASAAGVAAASCLNGRAVLRYAVPRDGFRSEVFERGPARVTVQFDGSRQRLRIAVRCVSGVPTATIRERGGGSGEGGGGNR
jgi:hypothetical protein